MVALKIEDIKTCTAKLFFGEDFDSFLMREANIVTFNSFTIDGHIRKGYYTSQELEEKQMEHLSYWKILRPFCFSLIKGKRLPESFSITLQMPERGIGRFLESSGLAASVDTVQALCMNIRYEEGTMSVITATSLAFFTLDKSIDMEWDRFVQEFLRKKGIAFTQ